MLLSPGSTGMATSLWSWGGGPAWPLIAWHPLLPPPALPVPPRLLWDVDPSTMYNGKWTSVSSGTRPCTYSLPPPPILLLSMTLNSQRAETILSASHPTFSVALTSLGLVVVQYETERKPEVPASPRGEALFRGARPSGVPRGPATSTGSLASQRHP